MSNGIGKRKRIFDKFVGQLKKMKENQILPDFIEYEEGVYICPICLNKFTPSDLNNSSNNMLTLEDAPPKSLGGKANTLTCKSCNNKCGHDIDFHLTERLLEIDARSFLPNSRAKATFSHNGIMVGGMLNVDSEGVITVLHDKKYNHPEKLDNYVSITGNNDVIDIKFEHSRVDMHRLGVALLKTAYILAFEQYGYILILNKSYNIVREQLKNPDLVIYPDGFWTKQRSFKKENEGVFIIESEGFEGFEAIFLLKTESSEYRNGVYLPVDDNMTIQIIEKFKVQEAGFILKLKSLSAFNYFEDIGKMKCLSDYLKNG